MAEERILIGTDIESPCQKCKDISICNADCEEYEKFAKEFNPSALKVYSRQEAYDKMAIAMCRFDCQHTAKKCENCKEWKKYGKCESLASVALEALLEDNK